MFLGTNYMDGFMTILIVALSYMSVQKPEGYNMQIVSTESCSWHARDKTSF